MELRISNADGRPIYEQIGAQLRQLILSGALREGEALPSIRALAKDLRISVITTKRAYDELERDGFINTVAGKGCYVAPLDRVLLREDGLRRVEALLREAAQLARSRSIPREELFQALELICEEDEYK